MDYYKILELDPNCTDKDIKDAYRKLAKKYHPDTYEGDKTFAENKMKELNEAYDYLSNPENREALRIKNNEKTTNTTSYTNSYAANSTSNYEEGTVYDFDKHFNHQTQANPYYNYSPYEDENDYTKMYYVDFKTLKNNLFRMFKYALLKALIVLIVILVVIGVTFNFAIKSIKNVFSLGNDATSVLTSPFGKVSDEQKEEQSISDDELKKYAEEFKKQWGSFGDYFNDYTSNAAYNVEDLLNNYKKEHQGDIDNIKDSLQKYLSEHNLNN